MSKKHTGQDPSQRKKTIEFRERSLQNEAQRKGGQDLFQLCHKNEGHKIKQVVFRENQANSCMFLHTTD